MEIQILKKQGFSLRQIAREVGCAVNTIRRQLAQDAAPKATVVHRMSCALVRFYVAKYTLLTAEAYARSSGASEAEIETARHCVSVQTAQK